MKTDGVEFLVELSIAVGVLNLALIVVVLFIALGISGKVNKQNDLIGFIHKRARIAERREEQMTMKDTRKKPRGNK